MNVSRLKGSSLQNACSMIPVNIMSSADMVLGCEEDESIAGVAAIIKKGDEWGIIWLYVLPEYRGKGAGGKLLDTTIDMADHEGVSILSSVMEADFEDRPLIELMLARRQFLITWKTITKMRVMADQLKKAALLPAYPKEHLGNNQVIPLGRISSSTINRFRKEAEEKGNLLVSRADYKNADGTKSMVLENDGNIVGILLLHREKQGQLYQIKLCYVDRQYRMHVVSMIKRAAKAMLIDLGDTKAIEFLCMDDSVVKLGERIFPKHELFRNDIVFGECWL